MSDDTAAIWDEAARRDSTLTASEADLAPLRRKRIVAEPYTRERHFSRMAAGQAVLFQDFPVPVASRPGESREDAVLRLLHTGFPRSQRARVQTGRRRIRAEVTVPELLRRWEGRRSIVSVTDLHIRGTQLERELGVEGLSDFNLLLHGTERMAVQEMMTLVVSSRGNVTDSHTDDPDGSNHAFAGKKLWIFWETLEGQAKGLQDVSLDPVVDQAAFDLRAFLAVRSARWLTVAAGETLFLPGKMTHKVVTLEPYLGVGSFYVALPSVLETLVRWYTRGPLWSLEDPDGETVGLVDEIARAATRKIRALQRGSRRAQARWGLDSLRAAVEGWEDRSSLRLRRSLEGIPAFAELLAAVRQAAAARAA